jgi:hypothetical protein
VHKPLAKNVFVRDAQTEEALCSLCQVKWRQPAMSGLLVASADEDSPSEPLADERDCATDQAADLVPPEALSNRLQGQRLKIMTQWDKPRLTCATLPGLGWKVHMAKAHRTDGPVGGHGGEYAPVSAVLDSCCTQQALGATGPGMQCCSVRWQILCDTSMEWLATDNVGCV